MRAKEPTRAEIERGLYGKKKNASSEADVLAAVMQWLNTLPNCKVWRQNVGGMQYLKADGSKGVVKFGEHGMSDITGMVHGIRIEVEIKRPGQKATLAQIAWLKFIRAKGGISFWCDSLESCTEQLRDEFELRGWKWDARWEVQ